MMAKKQAGVIRAGQESRWNPVVNSRPWLAHRIYLNGERLRQFLASISRTLVDFAGKSRDKNPYFPAHGSAGIWPH
ncbi:MAG: hypothetical protein O2985_04955, partial [Proteobacteria bacterium]|nr:hypothetical protein [Pseudomonadota bacterium]